MAVSLRERCSALFRDHRVEAFGGSFHVPDRQSYPALFAWDSGYHALSLLHLEPDFALEELTTLYRANRLPDGLLSHQRYVPGAEEHQRFIESLFGPMFEGDRTPFVDPPTAAYAVARLSLAIGAPADQLLDEAIGQLQALALHRTLDGRSLPAVLHPFETGTEGSALMRSLFARGLGAALPQLKDLTVSCRAVGMAPEAALAAGHSFVVYDPTVCGWYLLALEKVAAACRARGRGPEANEIEAAAELVARDIERVALVGRGTDLRRLRPDPNPPAARDRSHGSDPSRQPRPGEVGPVRTGRRAPSRSGWADVGAVRLCGRHHPT